MLEFFIILSPLILLKIITHAYNVGEESGRVKGFEIGQLYERENPFNGDIESKEICDVLGYMADLCLKAHRQYIPQSTLKYSKEYLKETLMKAFSGSTESERQAIEQAIEQAILFLPKIISQEEFYRIAKEKSKNYKNVASNEGSKSVLVKTLLEKTEAELELDDRIKKEQFLLLGDLEKIKIAS